MRDESLQSKMSPRNLVSSMTDMRVPFKVSDGSWCCLQRVQKCM